MGTGIGLFLLWENEIESLGLSHWDWDLLTGNWEKINEMGMG